MKKDIRPDYGKMKKDIRPDYGKWRVYRCACGSESIRPLHGPVSPCTRCNLPLDGQPFQVEDASRYIERMIDKTAGESR